MTVTLSNTDLSFFIILHYAYYAAFLDISMSYRLRVASVYLLGFGGSLCSSTAQISAFIYVDDKELADASVLWNINLQLSFCFGVMFISLLLNVLLNIFDIAQTNAHHSCFVLVVLSAFIPIILCLRIANRRVISTINQEK